MLQKTYFEQVKQFNFPPESIYLGFGGFVNELCMQVILVGLFDFYTTTTGIIKQLIFHMPLYKIGKMQDVSSLPSCLKGILGNISVKIFLSFNSPAKEKKTHIKPLFQPNDYFLLSQHLVPFVFKINLLCWETES